ncbi:hypothetical protein SDC9_159908 [bioreactor metagenome]|uniref:Uncharacterized protein n=1 Tax=bioreactor metagenome TaxID=1076179 RepID=A0A645FF62_9ZZZZ
MRDRLADDVVGGDEGALSAQCRLLGECDGAGSSEDLGVVVLGKFVQGFIVFDRADQRVSREQRPGIQKGDQTLGAPDDLRGQLPRDDLVEDVHAPILRSTANSYENRSSSYRHAWVFRLWCWFSS